MAITLISTNVLNDPILAGILAGLKLERISASDNLVKFKFDHPDYKDDEEVVLKFHMKSGAHMSTYRMEIQSMAPVYPKISLHELYKMHLSKYNIFSYLEYIYDEIQLGKKDLPIFNEDMDVMSNFTLHLIDYIKKVEVDSVLGSELIQGYLEYIKQ